MELLWNEFGVQRPVYRGTAQVEPDGAVPLPSNINSIAELIDYSAAIDVKSCRTEMGKVLVQGSIELQIAALDAMEKPFAFTSEADFTCSSDAEGVDTGMNADALPLLKSLSLRPGNAGQLQFNAVIDLELTVTTAAPMKTLSGISGLSDMEMKQTELRTARKVELANETVRLSEEITSDGVEDVLKYNLQLSLRDTSLENGNACLSGMLQFNALCRNVDGELSQIVRGIPFRESIALNGSADEIYALAEIRQANVHSLGTEFSLIAVDADVNFRIFAVRRGSLNLPVDAFSPSLDFTCIREEIRVLNVEGGACAQYSVRDNISVPEGYPDIFTALHASANPIVTGTVFEDGAMHTEGLLMTRFIYRSNDNSLHSFTEDIPFSINMSVPVETGFSRLRLSAQPSITGGGGRTAQISFTIDACAEFFDEVCVNAVTGIVENGSEREPESAFAGGIIIYNACEGETFFDVGKRFHVSCAEVASLNPDTTEPLHNGDKILLVV